MCRDYYNTKVRQTTELKKLVDRKINSTNDSMTSEINVAEKRSDFDKRMVYIIDIIKEIDRVNCDY